MATIGKYREQALESIALTELKAYDISLVTGDPRAIPIEEIIEQRFGLKVEYQPLSKKGSILGLTVFEDSPIPIYDTDNCQYELILVRGRTILIDERLCQQNKIGRLRFTLAHELAHYILHKEHFTKQKNIAAKSSIESNERTEREADILGAALLMPLGRVKIAFNRLCCYSNPKESITRLAELFEVSFQAMEIRLKTAGLI